MERTAAFCSWRWASIQVKLVDLWTSNAVNMMTPRSWSFYDGSNSFLNSNFTKIYSRQMPEHRRLERKMKSQDQSVDRIIPKPCIKLLPWALQGPHLHVFQSDLESIFTALGKSVRLRMWNMQQAVNFPRAVLSNRDLYATGRGLDRRRSGEKLRWHLCTFRGFSCVTSGFYLAWVLAFHSDLKFCSPKEKMEIKMWPYFKTNMWLFLSSPSPHIFVYGPAQQSSKWPP